MTTLIDFLLARIAEDEALASFGLPMPSPTRDGHTRYSPMAVRMMAECEAKRAIVVFADQRIPKRDDGEYQRGVAAAFDQSIRLLALPYADHESYDESWRP